MLGHSRSIEGDQEHRRLGSLEQTHSGTRLSRVGDIFFTDELFVGAYSGVGVPSI